MVEDPGGRRVASRRHVSTRLLIQPPRRQAHLGGYRLSFFQHDAVRLEQGINVAGGTAGIVSQGHRCTAGHIDVRHHTAPGRPVAELPEDLLDARTVKNRAGVAYAASIS